MTMTVAVLIAVLFILGAFTSVIANITAAERIDASIFSFSLMNVVCSSAILAILAWTGSSPSITLWDWLSINIPDFALHTPVVWMVHSVAILSFVAAFLVIPGWVVRNFKAGVEPSV